MISASFPSFFCFGIGGQSYSNFWASIVLGDPGAATCGAMSRVTIVVITVGGLIRVFITGPGPTRVKAWKVAVYGEWERSPFSVRFSHSGSIRRRGLSDDIQGVAVKGCLEAHGPPPWLAPV